MKIFISGLIMVTFTSIIAPAAYTDTGLKEKKEFQKTQGLDLLQEKLAKSPLPDSASFAKSDNFISYLLKASFSLVVILTIILGASYLLKKYQVKSKLFGEKYIHLLETCHLGPKKSIAFIQVENQHLLLGITQQQITLLKEFSPSQKDTLKTTKTVSGNSGNFSGQLAGKLNEQPLEQQDQTKKTTTTIANILEDRFKGLKKI